VSTPTVDPNCFARVGMRVPIKRGGKCPCGARVRFDIVKARTEHFMVCPEVDRRIARMQAPLEIDEAAVELARKLTDNAFG